MTLELSIDLCRDFWAPLPLSCFLYEKPGAENQRKMVLLFESFILRYCFSDCYQLMLFLCKTVLMKNK